MRPTIGYMGKIAYHARDVLKHKLDYITISELELDWAIRGCLETNLVNFEVIEVQKDQKTSFLASEKPANHTSEGKGNEKMGRARRKKRRIRKNAVLAWAILEIVFVPKNCLMEEVYFKNPARCDLYCLYRNIEWNVLQPKQIKCEQLTIKKRGNRDFLSPTGMIPSCREVEILGFIF